MGRGGPSRLKFELDHKVGSSFGQKFVSKVLEQSSSVVRKQGMAENLSTFVIEEFVGLPSEYVLGVLIWFMEVLHVFGKSVKQRFTCRYVSPSRSVRRSH